MVVNKVLDGQAHPIVIDVEAARELSVAMLEDSVPLVARVSSTNGSDAALSNLTVELVLLPDFSAKWTAHVSAIPVGGMFQLDTIELPLDRDRLVNQLERSRAELMLWVRDGAADLPIAVQSRPVDVLAYNEWSPITVPHLLAAYVLPNHPAVAELRAHARAPLERITHNPALDGYQSGSSARVAAIARAVYESLAACNITYSNPPASFEEIGQKIRTPEQVLKEASRDLSGSVRSPRRVPRAVPAPSARHLRPGPCVSRCLARGPLHARRLHRRRIRASQASRSRPPPRVRFVFLGPAPRGAVRRGQAARCEHPRREQASLCDRSPGCAANSLGFPRAGGKVADHLSAAVALLLTRGRAQRNGDKVGLA